jgi:hypothetical protein
VVLFFVRLLKPNIQSKMHTGGREEGEGGESLPISKYLFIKMQYTQNRGTPVVIFPESLPPPPSIFNSN